MKALQYSALSEFIKFPLICIYEADCTETQATYLFLMKLRVFRSTISLSSDSAVIQAIPQTVVTILNAVPLTTHTDH